MPNADPKKIFLVEDDVDLAEMLHAYFSAQGYHIGTTTSGEEAVKLISEDLPDVVVLDIRLPDIDGYEVCRRLRKTRRTRHLPVIFLTERRERSDILTGLELGAVDYITKPFDIQELRLRIRNALRRTDLRSLHNPITGLAEGPLVHERLDVALEQEGWGLVVAGINGLNQFRDQYGFVAADDVTRAVSLMITNAMQENGATDAFIGHLDAVVFVIITDADRCRQLAERCRVRVEPSIQYFYPAMDRRRVGERPASERLSVQIFAVDGQESNFTTVDALGDEINRLLQ